MKPRVGNKDPVGFRVTRLSLPAPPFRREEGSFLVVAVLFLSFVLTLVISTMGVVTTRVQDVRKQRNHLVAHHAAESGLYQEVANIRTARDLAAIQAAYNGIDALDPNNSQGTGGYTQAYDGQPLTDSSGKTVAEYDVFIDVTDRGNATSRTINISCYAYVPNKADYGNGVTDASRADAHVALTVPLGGSGVFDYSYFINHWGWFYGNNIIANGSVRSNGQFDFGGYASMINGSPRYASSNGYQLIGYQDDNKDGVKDGSDGGAYSGMAIVNQSAVRGMGALSQNQHQYEASVPMPNLSDLTLYEQKAIAAGSTIKVGGTTVVAGVLGDDSSEKKNVYLKGTAADPIILNGSVVVRGNVIISGVVKGQGSIFASGNIYVPNNLSYSNPPPTRRPTSNDQATVEAWRQDAMTRDALGLYTAQHMVISDYTNSSWQSNVSSWVNHPLNKSAEDAGMDGVQNTKAGRDGILGTADDDVLEGDGVWTVSRYTDQDLAKGLIPAGKSVGDVVPGSGEDIDGDGKFDGPTQMSEFNLPVSLTASNWAGNMPTTVTKFSDFATINMSQVDAVLYTNHTLPTLMIAPAGSDIQFNGAIISRNESIIYSARNIIMNHDERLTGGSGGLFGLSPPVTWNSMTMANWEYDKELPPSVLASPSTVKSYFSS